MAMPASLPTVRRVLALKRRALRSLRAELGRSARRLSDLDGQRTCLDGARSALFAPGAGALALDLLRFADVEREWLIWLRRRRDAERDRLRLEEALAGLRAEIRALEVYVNRLAAGSR